MALVWVNYSPVKGFRDEEKESSIVLWEPESLTMDVMQVIKYSSSAK